MTPKIVITGTAGFLGSHLLDAVLRHTDFDVIAVDSLRHNGWSRNVRNVLDNVPQYAGRVEFIAHDLTAPFHRTDLRHLVNVDYIIHAAAFSQVGHSITDPVGFVSNNVQGALTMLEVARLSPDLRRFVLISTDEVYGAETNIDDSSMTHYRPSSPYAASKACQELIAHSYQKSFRLPLTTFNISNMFGPRQSQLAFIPQVIRKLRATAAGRFSPIDVHVDENDRPGGRYYSFVEDVAHSIMRHLHGDVNDYRSLSSRVHVPGHNFVDNDTLVRSFHQISGVKTSADQMIRYVNVRTSHPGHDINYGRLAGLNGWKPETPRVSAFKLTWDWYNLHPEWLEV